MNLNDCIVYCFRKNWRFLKGKYDLLYEEFYFNELGLNCFIV